jgi:hypothetical protein
MNQRPKGVWTYKSPVNAIAEEAKKRQRQKQELLAAAREARAARRPLLNRDRYPNLYAKWLAQKEAGGTSRQPKCPMCREATLHWNEPAHECSGFKPMFVEHDEAWHERMEAQREAIREAKRNGRFFSEDEDEPEDDYCEEDDDCEDDGDPMWD